MSEGSRQDPADRERLRNPYGTARDLPSYRELDKQLRGLSSLRFVLGKDMRGNLKSIRGGLERLVETVDEFYELLGERNWVFHDTMDVEAIAQVCATGEPDEAESRLIAYYREDNRLSREIRQIRCRDELRPRADLMEHALDDYEAGRYYATVLVLLTVTDGFVNDVELARRKGLHAREGDELLAWDSVTAHHLGLAHAQGSFTKSIYKTDDSATTELHRHGILHGTLVNFDNVVVATKAWNRLFALADWAKNFQDPPVPDVDPTWREVLASVQSAQIARQRVEDFKSYELDAGQDEFGEHELNLSTEDLLTRWSAGQWGPVGEHLLILGTRTPTVGDRAVLAKNNFELHPLESWSLSRIRRPVAALGFVDVELEVSGDRHRCALRWVRLNTDGDPVSDGEPGKWFLAPYGPSVFLSQPHGWNGD